MKKTPRPRGKTDSGDSLVSRLKEQIRDLKATVRRLQKQISKLKDEILVTESSPIDWEAENLSPTSGNIEVSKDLCRKCKSPYPVRMEFDKFTVTYCNSCGDRYRKPRKPEES